MVPGATWLKDAFKRLQLRYHVRLNIFRAVDPDPQGSAFILLSWLRIRIQNAHPALGARRKKNWYPVIIVILIFLNYVYLDRLNGFFPLKESFCLFHQHKTLQNVIFTKMFLKLVPDPDPHYCKKAAGSWYGSALKKPAWSRSAKN